MTDDFLADFGPELRERKLARHAAERKRLRQQLADQAQNVARVRELEAAQTKAFAEIDHLRAQVAAAEEAARPIGDALASARSVEADARMATFRELEAVPAPEFLAFRREVDHRIESVDSLVRSWPGRRRDPIYGTPLPDYNRGSVDVYTRALITTRDEIEVAVRLGLDGKEADAAVVAMRAKWPKVQFGPDEWRVP